jgi:predicted dehydrogenase
MESTSLKYGFVGAGFIARFQLAAIRQLRGIDVVGVTAPQGAPELASMARAWGVGDAAVYRSVAEMARHVDVIAIFASSDMEGIGPASTAP